MKEREKTLMAEIEALKKAAKGQEEGKEKGAKEEAEV